MSNISEGLTDTDYTLMSVKETEERQRAELREKELAKKRKIFRVSADTLFDGKTFPKNIMNMPTADIVNMYFLKSIFTTFDEALGQSAGCICRYQPRDLSNEDPLNFEKGYKDVRSSTNW